MKTKRTKMDRLSRNEAISGYLFILPFMIPFIAFILMSIVAALGLSMTDYNLLESPNIVGFKNFVKLINDSRMWKSLGNSLRFTILSVFITNFIGLILALMINRKIPKSVSYFIRLLYFLPVIVAYAYISLIWGNLLSKDTGIINYYLSKIGIEPIGWLRDMKFALYSIVMIDVWKNSGLAMIIYLAGLQSISPELYEAARIDGANGFRVLIKITLPLLAHVITFNFIIFMINAIQIFDPIKLLTNGGPGDASRSLVLYIYDNFAQMKMGYSSAVSIMLLLIIMLFTLVEFKISDKLTKI